MSNDWDPLSLTTETKDFIDAAPGFLREKSKRLQKTGGPISL
jgi:hypothetical protein